MLYTQDEILDYCHSHTRFSSDITGIERMGIAKTISPRYAEYMYKPPMRAANMLLL